MAYKFLLCYRKPASFGSIGLSTLLAVELANLAKLLAPAVSSIQPLQSALASPGMEPSNSALIHISEAPPATSAETCCLSLCI